jgi:hypothetical protein
MRDLLLNADYLSPALRESMRARLIEAGVDPRPASEIIRGELAEEGQK